MTNAPFTFTDSYGYQVKLTESDLIRALAERGLVMVRQLGAEPTGEELLSLHLDTWFRVYREYGDDDDSAERKAADAAARLAIFNAGRASAQQQVEQLTARVGELEADVETRQGGIRLLVTRAQKAERERDEALARVNELEAEHERRRLLLVERAEYSERRVDWLRAHRRRPNAKLERAERERDEARSELERVKAWNDGGMQGLIDGNKQLRASLEKQRAVVEAALALHADSFDGSERQYDLRLALQSAIIAYRKALASAGSEPKRAGGESERVSPDLPVHRDEETWAQTQLVDVPTAPATEEPAPKQAEVLRVGYRINVWDPLLNEWSRPLTVTELRDSEIPAYDTDGNEYRVQWADRKRREPADINAPAGVPVERVVALRDEAREQRDEWEKRLKTVGVDHTEAATCRARWRVWGYVHEELRALVETAKPDAGGGG